MCPLAAVLSTRGPALQSDNHVSLRTSRFQGCWLDTTTADTAVETDAIRWECCRSGNTFPKNLSVLESSLKSIQKLLLRNARAFHRPLYHNRRVHEAKRLFPHQVPGGPASDDP